MVLYRGRGGHVGRHSHGIGHKGRPCHDSLVTRRHESLDRYINKLVRAVAYHHLALTDAKAFGQGPDEMETPAIGIPVEAVQDRGANGRYSLWRRAERVLVRGELDRIAYAQLALKLLF